MYLFTKENAVGLVRTFIAYVYAWLLVQIPGLQDWLADLGLNEEAVATGAAVVIGTLLYQAIRWGAEKFPKLGYLLIFNDKPKYANT